MTQIRKDVINLTSLVVLVETIKAPAYIVEGNRYFRNHTPTRTHYILPE